MTNKLNAIIIPMRELRSLLEDPSAVKMKPSHLMDFLLLCGMKVETTYFSIDEIERTFGSRFYMFDNQGQTFVIVKSDGNDIQGGIRMVFEADSIESLAKRINSCFGMKAFI